MLYDEPMTEEKSDEEILAMERQVFGFSHAETGGYLMHTLNFPPVISAIVERHHDLTVSDEVIPSVRTLLHIVVLANRLANTIGYGFNRELSQQAFAEDPILDILLEDNIFDVKEKVLLIEEAFELKPHVDEYLNEVI